MRIAQIAPLAESVPPKLYGGTERVVAWLVDGLVGLGHAVTLFASGDSVTRAQLNSVWPRALRLGRPRSDPMAAQAVLLEAMSQQAAEFDVIHAHIDWLHLPLLSRLGVPFVTTTHGRLDLPGLPDVVSRFPVLPSFQFRTINAPRLAGQTGSAPCITACPPICSAPASNRDLILPSSAGSPPRRDLKLQFALRVPRECRFASRRKYRVARGVTSRNGLNRKSMATRSG
jgi:glycosyltransferase involved in cell wall biosynthesis